MIGNFNLPIAKGNAKTYVFNASPSTMINATANIAGMQRWDKPKGINFVYGLLISAGSGGGGGFSFGAGTAGGGGGGGTPGVAVQFLQSAYLVPDTLYITVPVGGTGGAAGTAGTLPMPMNTQISYTSKTANGISFGGDFTTTYIFPAGTLGYSGQQSGRGGTISAGGAGGTASIPIAGGQYPGVNGYGNGVATSALTGNAGGFAAAGTNALYASTGFGGGAGGGGVSSSIAYSGGNVLAPTTSEQSIWNQTLPGGANTGASGSNGITLFEPTFFSLPGAGGGANASGVGGNGGKGGIGCGGGGGGAGTTGGRGGDGGDGLVILVCW